MDRQRAPPSASQTQLQIATLKQHFVSITKNESAEPVPLGLVDPVVSFGNVRDSLREHRRDGCFARQIHITHLTPLA